MTFRKNLNGLVGGLALAVAGVVATAPVPAHAQFGGIVYDPSNYAQNVLTAARTLEQINNQTQTAQVRTGRRVHIAVDEPGTRTHSGILTAREILG